MKRSILFLIAVALMTGCASHVKDTDAQLIRQQAANCEAMNDKIQQYKFTYTDSKGNTGDASFVNRWWNAENSTWQSMAAWAEKTESNQPVPADVK